jgi:hypothetical protein
MQCIFNELSATLVANSEDIAKGNMSSLINIIRILSSHGFEKTLRMPRNFREILLSQNYRISQWMNDSNVDSIERLFFKTVASKAPYTDEILSYIEKVRSEDTLFEFKFENTKSNGLGLAFLQNYPSISFVNNPKFAQDPLSIIVTTVDEQGVDDKHEEICNFYSTDQIQGKKDWLLECIRREIPDGETILSMKEQFFPNLDFCQSTYKQLKSLTGDEPYFKQISRHLFELNSYLSDWTQGAFLLNSVSWSEESSPTLQHGTYGPMRVFKCNDGEERQFSAHLKPSGGNIRIHFYPVLSERKAFIGYIGRHLPTITYKT